MKLLLLLYILLLTNSFAKDNVWSKDTPSLSDAKSEKIIQMYQENNQTNLEFVEDIDEEVVYDFRENILMFGLELGFSSNREKVYNTTGEKTENFSSSSVKLVFGKDFTLWHIDYTQPSRIYVSYEYTLINEDVSYTTFMVGLQENMFYWSLYKNDTLNIYPTFNLELGSSSITRDTFTSSGFTTGAGVGVALVYDDNFEYFINFHSKQVAWEHPVDGVADEMSSFGLNIGLNYKLMYGDI